MTPRIVRASHIVTLSGCLALSATLGAQTFKASDVNGLAAGNHAIKPPAATDSTPPTARIELHPRANAAGWNRSDVTVKFVCKDTGGSGLAQCPPPIIVATEGTNEVSGTVIDKAGNRATVTGVVKLDRTAPVLAIDAPGDGALVYDSPVPVAGKVSDATAGLASVNCANAPASVEGVSFACEMALEPGAHHVRVWASDLAGNVTIARRRVVLGPRLPGADAHQARVDVDLNGDGRLDVVRTDFVAGDVVIRLTNPDGSFQGERRVHVGDYPSAIAVADINRDGVLDLITAQYTTSEVAIQYGQSNGSYAPGPRIEVDAFPSAVLVADVDGDGRMDLVTAHMHSQQVHVHLAKANGRFVEQPSVKAGDGPVALAIADLTGDGTLDLVVANYLSRDVSILRGKGKGRFASEQRVALAPASSTAPAPSAIMIADVNGDGVLDVVTASFDAGSIALLLGSGPNGFGAAQILPVGQQPVALRAADVTGDGKLDLITANLGSGDFSVLAGQGLGSFAPAQSTPAVSAAARMFVARPLQVGTLVQLPGISAVVGANMPNPFSIPVRAPAAGLPAPADRVGLTFGADTGAYGGLLGPDGVSYVPLVAAARAGVKWVRVDANRSSFFGADASMNYLAYSQFVDRLLAAGFNAHIIVTDFRWWPPAGIPFPADFPTASYLQEYAQFAGELAHATHREDRVVFEVWNEPDAFGLFWPPQRAGKNEAELFAGMLTQVTEAMHKAAPGSVVISGGLTTDGVPYAAKFLPAYNAKRANRPQAAVDRFGFHAYPSANDTLAGFRSELDAAGLALSPIDITEVGGWWSSRDWVSKLNVTILLHAVESDIPHVNFWAALSPPDDDMAMAGFMDVATGETRGCQASIYGAISGIAGYRCHPSMHVLRTFDRVARGRTYQGALFDARTGALPGAVASDPLSGLHALKFESGEDVVVAVYTPDRPRDQAAGSGRAYAVEFPVTPIFAIGSDGLSVPTPDAQGRYQVTHDGGAVYFFFSKIAEPPTLTVSARAVCADGGLPRRGSLQLWHTVWPTPGAAAPLDWQTPGAGDPALLTTVSRKLPLFGSNMYVAAEIAPDSGRFLPVRSSTQTGGGPGAPTVTDATFFDPPTEMARLDAPSSTSGIFQIDYLAPPEWCTP